MQQCADMASIRGEIQTLEASRVNQSGARASKAGPAPQGLRRRYSKLCSNRLGSSAATRKLLTSAVELGMMRTTRVDEIS